MKTKNYRHMTRALISIALAITLDKTVRAQTPIPTPTPAPEVRISAHPHPHPHVHIHDFEDSEMTVSEQETINKSLPLPASSERRHVTVDDVWGAIHVSGTNSSQVEFVAKKTIRAESDRKSTRLNSSHVSISYAVF